MTIRTARRMAVVLATLAVAGCAGDPDKAREEIQSLDSLNVIDENNLNELMLNFASPEQSVQYFRRALSQEPDRVEFQRGYARALMNAGRAEEAAAAFADMAGKGTLNDADRLKYAEALIQIGEWGKARAQLDRVPPTMETYDRFRLEAMVADHEKQWARADQYYAQARELTTRPASIYNNWGISKIARGDRPAAEEMFVKAISYDSTMFSAKNNLAISRAARRVYQLPLVPMTKTEEAELLHNIALQAIRNGDVDIGRGLLEKAVETHPRYYSEAADKLAALDAVVVR